MNKTLRLSKVTVEGFWSMKDRFEFTFPAKGPVLITGNWKDSTVSSGSGKSIIPRAIRFVLGFSDTPATELKNWESKKMFASLTLEDGENVYEITRDPKLSIKINGLVYGNDGAALTKSAEEKLEEILGAKIDIVSVLINRTQREYGRFLNDTDAANKEFLCPLLNLTELEAAAEQWDGEIASIEGALALKEQERAFTEQNLGNYKIEPGALEKAEAEWTQARDAYRLAPPPDDPQTKKELELVEKELLSISNAKDLLTRTKYENSSIRSAVENLTKEVEILSKQICVMCKREWDQAKDTLEAKKNQIQQYLEKMKVNLSVISNSEPIVANESAARNRQIELRSKLSSLAASLEPLRQRESSAYHLLSVLKGQKDNFDRANEKLKKLQEESESLSLQLEIKKHSSAMIGRDGMQGSIFDEVLRDIEAKTNNMISRIPNMNGITLKISSTKVTQKGKAKKSITKGVYKFGKAMGLRNLSGGQQCALELCIDLAVRAVVMARTGLRLGWITLDESLFGLDAEPSLAMLEILRTEVDGLVLVIDHATEVKEGFEKIIKIEYNGRESYVTAA